LSSTTVLSLHLLSAVVVVVRLNIADRPLPHGENVRRENIRKENIRKENIRKENIRKENIRRGTLQNQTNITKDNPVTTKAAVEGLPGGLGVILVAANLHS